MKKETKKKIITVSLILVILVITGTMIFAAGESGFPGTGTPSTKVSTISRKVWSTVKVVFQALSFGAIVFAGIKYMFAAPDEKADLKNGLTLIVLGAVLVFSTSTFAGFIYETARDILT